MDYELIENSIHSSATEYTRDRLAIIGDGTGNLLKIGNRLFIVTCLHVAKQFFEYDNFHYVVIRENERVFKKNIKLIDSYNDQIDIALIEINQKIIIRGAYELNDFDVHFDLNDEEIKNAFYFICGFPGGLTFKNDFGIQYPYLSFTTKLLENKRNNKEFIYLKYSREEEHREYQSNLNTKFPNPHGLSGAFILRIVRTPEKSKELWTPNVLKIVAIQQSYLSKEKYIKGTNIIYLINLLKKNKIV